MGEDSLVVRQKYCAFICYSQADARAAEVLQRRLESYRVPGHLVGRRGARGPIPERLTPIFRDAAELAASGDISADLKAALAQSDALIVLCSPVAAKSRWVNAEIEFFRNQQPATARPVLAVLLSGEPVEAFPPALLPNQPVWEQPYPLAADFRPARERGKDADLRLIAALLGVGFDELRQREQSRQLRRLRATVSVLVLVAVTFAALAIFALSERHQAQQASVRANEARAGAEQLVDYMLDDLRGKLEALGKLNPLDRANEHVRRYYQRIAPGEKDVSALRHRSLVLTQHGDDLLAEGRPKGAHDFYLAARSLRERLVQLQPTQSEFRAELATTYKDLGEASLKANESQSAKSEVESAIAILKQLTTADAKNARWQIQLAETKVELSDVEIQLGETGAAVIELRNATATFAKFLTEKAPVDLQLAHAHALDKLADVLRKSGHSREAEPYARRAIAVNETLAKKEPGNVKVLDRLQFSYAYLSELMGELGRNKEAIVERKKRLVIAQRLASLEPRNATYQVNLATSYTQLGEVLCQGNHFSDAQPYIEKALAVSLKLVEEHPNNASYLSELATRYNHLLDLDVGLGKKEEALVAGEEAIAARRKACANDPANRELQHWLSYDIFCAGSAELNLHQFTKAAARFEEATAIEKKLVAEDPANLTRLQFLSLYQLNLGDALRSTQPNEAKSAYEECRQTIQLFLTKGGAATAVKFVKDNLAKSLAESAAQPAMNVKR